MSPEQAVGRADVDARSDLYSLGVVAYEMVSGRRPFDAESPMDALTQRLTRDPRPLGSAASEVPPDLALAVGRCLQRDVTKRWPDARACARRFCRLMRNPRFAFREDASNQRDDRVAHGARLWICIGYSALNPNFGCRSGYWTARGTACDGDLGCCRDDGLRSKAWTAGAFSSRLQQPRRWRSWYRGPSTARGRMETVSRTSPPLSLYRGISRLYVGDPPAVAVDDRTRPLLAGRRVLDTWATAVVGMALLLAERRRATKFVRAKVAMTAAEASAILTTSTWGTSTWRRATTSSLLGDRGHTPRRAIEAPDPTASERTTQL